MSAPAYFPVGPFIDTATGDIALPWKMWLQNPTFSSSNPVNPVNVSSGGTGRATLTAHGVLVGNGPNPINITTPGAANTVLRGNGASNDPSFGKLNLFTDTSGIPLAVQTLNANAVIPAGYAGYVPGWFEVALGITFEVGLGSFFEVG